MVKIKIIFYLRNVLSMALPVDVFEICWIVLPVGAPSTPTENFLDFPSVPLRKMSEFYLK
jgi:hypothetical protein